MSKKNIKEPNTVLFTWSFGVVITVIGASMLAGVGGALIGLGAAILVSSVIIAIEVK